MVKKKRVSPAVWNVIALVTAFGILVVFVLSRDQGFKSSRELTLTIKPSHDGLTPHNDHYIKKLKKINKQGKTLNDALWTAKPYVQRKLQNLETKRLVKNSSTLVSNIGYLDLNIDELDARTVTSLGTTPKYTDKPTTPITTQSITTPIYTEKPTTPITTQSITTPAVTEPGYKDVTTEGYDKEDDEPNETILLIRQRRGAAPVTPTTQFPFTSSVKPPTCGDGGYDDDSYTLSTGECICSYEYKEEHPEKEECETAKTPEYCVEFTTQVYGEFNNSQRAAFHEALEEFYKDLAGYESIYVFPLTYNATSNTTTIHYLVCFKEEASAENLRQAASTTGSITTNSYNIVVGNTDVTFVENSSFYIKDKEDGTIELIPVGSQAVTDPCYIYDEINACGANGGKCVDNNGTAYCLCPDGYMGPYCDREVVYETNKDNTLAILLPVMAGVAALALCCSCCWLCCRSVGKGEDEYTTISSESIPPVILPRYHPYQFKQFIGGAAAEEQNTAPIIIEREIIQPIYVERIAANEVAVPVAARPKKLRVERVIKEEIIRRPVVVERLIDEDVVDERVIREGAGGGEVIQERMIGDERADYRQLRGKWTNLDDNNRIYGREYRELRDHSDNGSSNSDLSWMFGQQSHDRFKIKRPNVNGQADSRFNFFDSKYQF